MGVPDPALLARSWLKVCITCDRHATDGGTQGLRGTRLADAIEADLRRRMPDRSIVELCRVHCLSGCLHPGNVALGAFGKGKLRFHGLDTEDAGAVVSLALAHAASAESLPDMTDWPEPLRNRVAAQVPARPIHPPSSSATSNNSQAGA